METNNQKNDQNIIPNDADKQQKGVNVPNLRFSEFNNYYSKCILDDIADVTKLAGFEFTKYVTYNEHGSIIALRGLNCKDGRLILDDVKFIDNSNLKMLKRSKLYINDILFTYVGTVGETAIITENDKYYLAPNVARIRLKTNQFNAIYLQELLNKNKFKQKIISPLIATSSQPALTIENIRLFKLKLPNIYEQTKVAEFFTIINARIDTQSKIIEDLQTLKISICDKVFDDTTYPEYKLKDVLSERIEKSNVNNQYEILSSTIKGLFTQKEYFDKDIASSNNIGYKIVHLYDIIISPQNLWMGNITFNQRFTNGLVSPSYKIYTINNNFDMYYIANMLKTKKAMYKYICSSQQGASVVRRNLNMDDFLSLSFNIPDINKQRKIGLLLNTINKRIDLEQTYLTKLNQQKKFLLKNMFI